MVQASNGATLEVARGEDLRNPLWSPDGSELLFIRNEATKKVGGTLVVSPLGGVARQIADAPYACWLEPDGSLVVVAHQSEASGFEGVRVVNTITGESKEIRLLQYSWLWDVDCSPHAGHGSGRSGVRRRVEHERVWRRVMILDPMVSGRTFIPTKQLDGEQLEFVSRAVGA